MIIWIGRARNSVFVFKEDGFVLARVAGVEAVEIIEPEPAGPVIERADFAGFPRRCVVVFPDPRSCVAVLSEYFGNRPRTLRDDTGVAVVTSREFGDHACSSHMMIATCQQCGARRRAQCSRVETGIAQTVRRQLLDIGRRYTAAESTKLTEAHIVEQD